MAEANDKYGIIYQNLVDAGCNQKTIQCCMKLAQENNVYLQFRLLSTRIIVCIAEDVQKFVRSSVLRKEVHYDF